MPLPHPSPRAAPHAVPPPRQCNATMTNTTKGGTGHKLIAFLVRTCAPSADPGAVPPPFQLGTGFQLLLCTVATHTDDLQRTCASRDAPNGVPPPPQQVTCPSTHPLCACNTYRLITVHSTPNSVLSRTCAPRAAPNAVPPPPHLAAALPPVLLPVLLGGPGQPACPASWLHQHTCSREAGVGRMPSITGSKNLQH
jgi:hypothetical protein